MEEEFSIGYWIKRRRKALDMTQGDLANRVGCALITIAKIEADQRRPSQEIAELLAQHLNIPEEQRSLFVKILRGLKSSVLLRRITAADFQSPEQPTTPPAISSSEADKLRGMELIGRISRSKLVGRGAELMIARNLWRSARAGESQALILQGEAGIGKSRLARELIQDFKPSEATILIGECFAEGGMPYAPIVRILQGGTIPANELPRVVLADLKNIAPHLAIQLPNLSANPPLDPHGEQMRLFESVHVYFRYFYERKPLIILIEDVHWADHGSIALLQSLMHRFQQTKAPVLMVMTTRDVAPTASPALNSFFDDLLRSHLSTTLHLERFDQNGTYELLAAIFAQDITDEFIQFMHRETQGNPFFIEEVCKDLIESKQIYWDKGRWERKNLTELRVPQNIRAAIETRLDKLGKETRELLQTASAMGRRFEFDVLRHAMAENEEDLIEWLDVARNAQLIQELDEEEDGDVFEFSHVLIASVLQEGMSAPRRRITHKHIVEALEKIHPNDFSLLAYHCREAAEHETAAGYFRKAGEQAMSAFAHEDAIRFYSDGLAIAPAESPEACQLLLVRAKVYDLRGERSLQLADLQAAEEKAQKLQDTSAQAAVALAKAEYAIQMTEQSEVIEHARRAIQLSEQAGLPSITAQAYMLWGRALSEMGELKESRDHLMHAASIARQAGLGLIEMRSIINSGNIDYRLGEYDAAREKYQSSLGTLRKLGERRIECMVINNLGNIHWVKGDLEAATQSYRQTLQIAREIGDRLNEARALSNIGSILTEQHLYADALKHLEQALPILRDLGQQADESIVLGHMADVMESLGRYEEAYQFKMEAWELARAADDPQSEAEFLTGLSRIEAFRKNYSVAEEFARQAIQLAQQHEYRVEEAAAWQALGLTKVAAGNLAEGEEAYGKSLALYEALEQAGKTTELRAELAWLAYERGDDAMVQKQLALILPNREPETLRSLQQPSTCWCCYEILKADDPSTAQILLENGHAALHEVAEKISESKARDHYLKQLPHHAELVNAWSSRNKQKRPKK